MEEEFPKLERLSLILVTGLPFSAAEELSQCLRGWAKCPWLKHEVVLKSLWEESSEDIDNPNPPASEEEAARLLRLSFSTTCSSALFLLTNSSPNKCVVISSSNLSYKSQLFRLLKIMQRDLSGSRLLIIDCKHKNKFIWQRYADREYKKRTSWYWPRNWDDVDKAIQHHQQEGVHSYFPTLLIPPDSPSQPEFQGVDAIKLVVDPFKDLIRDFHASESNPKLKRGSLFIEAIKDLLTCDDLNNYGGGTHVVDYPEWRRQRIEEQGRSFAFRVTTQHHWCPSPGDCIFRLTHNLSPQQEEEEAEICEICDGEIGRKEVAYYCQYCSLSFHQSCCSPSPTRTAEDLSQLLGSVKFVFIYAKIADHPLWSHQLDILLHKLFKGSTHPCYSCIRQGKSFSGSCDSCVYRTTLKSKLLSPVFTHSCDQPHILTMALSQDAESFRYVCRACGCVGEDRGYCCNICSSDGYHMECLHLPLQILEHPHGGHLHQINIQFSCPSKEYEYEWCLGCYKDIDPQTWAYRCQQCDYVAHLYCVFPFLSLNFPTAWED